MPIRLPKKSTISIGPKYELLGLSDMPFPSDGFVDPYSHDPRINGSIYAMSTAQPAITKFENLLIRPDDFPNRVRLAYLWSKGDSQSGRGVGKTALLRYFRHRINSDWGQTEFNSKFSAVVVYVGVPEPGRSPAHGAARAIWTRRYLQEWRATSVAGCAALKFDSRRQGTCDFRR